MLVYACTNCDAQSHDTESCAWCGHSTYKIVHPYADDGTPPFHRLTHKPNPQQTFAEELTELRQDLGWTQQRLAGLAGVDQSTISLAESGTTPTDKLARKLERAFDLPLNYWTMRRS